jgi:hypothetical protein
VNLEKTEGMVSGVGCVKVVCSADPYGVHDKRVRKNSLASCTRCKTLLHMRECCEWCTAEVKGVLQCTRCAGCVVEADGEDCVIDGTGRVASFVYSLMIPTVDIFALFHSRRNLHKRES